MRRALALLTVLVLAGCAAPAAVQDAPLPATALPPEVMLMPCVEHAGDFPIELAEAQKHLPPGLKPRAVAPGTAATLELIFLECGEPALRAFTAWMLVEAPPEMQASGVAGYFFVFAVVAEDPALVEALRAAGLPAEPGTIAIESAQTPGSVRGNGRVEADGWSAGIDVVIPQRDVVRAHPIYRGFVGNESGITHAVDLDSGTHPHKEVGTGTMDAAGAPPFPVSTVPGVAVYGTELHLGVRLVTAENLTAPPTPWR